MNSLININKALTLNLTCEVLTVEWTSDTTRLQIGR